MPEFFKVNSVEISKNTD